MCSRLLCGSTEEMCGVAVALADDTSAGLRRVELYESGGGGVKHSVCVTTRRFCGSHTRS